MADLEQLDRAHDNIMQCFIKTGHAPHYTELANDLGIPMEEGKKIFRELLEAGIPGWIHPQTDWLASYPPFNNQPTQYYMSVEGEQKWYAQ